MSGAIHATAVVVDGCGLLIRGSSGAGKSLLALELIERATLAQKPAALVADDRVWLEAVDGRLIARGAPGLAGLCELRGLGLVETPYQPTAAIRLIVDIAERGASPPRFPEEADRYATLSGLALPRFALDLSPGVASGATAVHYALKRLEGDTWRKIDLDGAVFA